MDRKPLGNLSPSRKGGDFCRKEVFPYFFPLAISKQQLGIVNIEKNSEKKQEKESNNTQKNVSDKFKSRLAHQKKIPVFVKNTGIFLLNRYFTTIEYGKYRLRVKSVSLMFSLMRLQNE